MKEMIKERFMGPIL